METEPAMKMSAKGQLSFDMAFAIVLLMTVIGMLVSYFNQSEATMTVMEGRKLMALNLIADYTMGNLDGFYSSLIRAGADANVTYVADFPNKYLFEHTASGNKYKLDYTATILSDKVRFSVPGGGLSIERKLSWLKCGSTSLTLAPGKKLKLKGCKLIGSSVSCSCSVI